jgi:hypothetical protein
MSMGEAKTVVVLAKRAKMKADLRVNCILN